MYYSYIATVNNILKPSRSTNATFSDDYVSEILQQYTNQLLFCCMPNFAIFAQRYFILYGWWLRAVFDQSKWKIKRRKFIYNFIFWWMKFQVGLYQLINVDYHFIWKRIFNYKNALMFIFCFDFFLLFLSIEYYFILNAVHKSRTVNEYKFYLWKI